MNRAKKAHWLAVIIFLFAIEYCFAQQNDTAGPMTSEQAISIAQMEGKRWYRNDGKWIAGAIYDTTSATWTVTSAKHKEKKRITP